MVLLKNSVVHFNTSKKIHAEHIQFLLIAWHDTLKEKFSFG